MPSYQYLRDIKPDDLKPDQGPEYSKKEKAANWWHYSWKWVLLAAVVLALVVYFVADTMRAKEPDLTIGVFTRSGLPDQLVQKMQEELAAYVGDMNGDGAALVELQVYVLQPPQSESDLSAASSAPVTAVAEDPYAQMAGIAHLTGAMESGNPVIFMFEADSLQEYFDAYGLPGNLDGSEAEPGSDPASFTYAFTDVPALIELDLDFEYYDGTVLDGLAAMEGYRVGVRPINGEDDHLWHKCKALLDAMLAGEPPAAAKSQSAA